MVIERRIFMFVDRVDNSLALTAELQKHGFSVNTVKPIA